ncbi:MAG: hypothetical protein ACTSPB_02075 [Candidatus Thorarchaeota archaeon]
MNTEKFAISLITILCLVAAVSGTLAPQFITPSANDTNISRTNPGHYLFNWSIGTDNVVWVKTMFQINGVNVTAYQTTYTTNNETGSGIKYVSINYTGMSDGIYCAKLYVENTTGKAKNFTGGNWSEERCVRYDTTPPTITKNNPASVITYGYSNLTINFTIADAQSSLPTCSGNLYVEWDSTNYTLTSASGSDYIYAAGLWFSDYDTTKTMKVYANDSRGNSRVQSYSIVGSRTPMVNFKDGSWDGLRGNLTQYGVNGTYDFNISMLDVNITNVTIIFSDDWEIGALNNASIYLENFTNNATIVKSSTHRIEIYNTSKGDVLGGRNLQYKSFGIHISSGVEPIDYQNDSTVTFEFKKGSNSIGSYVITIEQRRYPLFVNSSNSSVTLSSGVYGTNYSEFTFGRGGSELTFFVDYASNSVNYTGAECIAGCLNCTYMNSSAAYAIMKCQKDPDETNVTIHVTSTGQMGRSNLGYGIALVGSIIGIGVIIIRRRGRHRRRT